MGGGGQAEAEGRSRPKVSKAVYVILSSLSFE